LLEHIEIFEELIKINNRGKHQRRVLVITNSSIYTLKKKLKVLSLFGGSKYVVRLSVDAKHIKNVKNFDFSDGLLINFNICPPLNLISIKRHEIIEFILKAIVNRVGKDSKLPFYTIKQEVTCIGTGACRQVESLEEITLESFQFRFAFNKSSDPGSESQAPLQNIEDYKILKLLGYGGFSKVFLVLKKSTKELFALKYVKLDEKRTKNRSQLYKDQVRVERDILATHTHPFIMKLKYAFQIDRQFYFMMPYIQGGEFLQYVQREKNTVQKENMYFNSINI